MWTKKTAFESECLIMTCLYQNAFIHLLAHLFILQHVYWIALEGIIVICFWSLTRTFLLCFIWKEFLQQRCQAASADKYYNNCHFCNIKTTYQQPCWVKNFLLCCLWEQDNHYFVSEHDRIFSQYRISVQNLLLGATYINLPFI